MHTHFDYHVRDPSISLPLLSYHPVSGDMGIELVTAQPDRKTAWVDYKEQNCHAYDIEKLCNMRPHIKQVQLLCNSNATATMYITYPKYGRAATDAALLIQYQFKHIGVTNMLQ
jgi:hypothetical protein